MNYKIAVIFLFVFLYCTISYSQEEANRIEVNGDEVEYFPKEKKVVGVGNISIDYGDVRLTSDKIIVHTDTKDVEAEGKVILKNPTTEIRGEKIRYNFETKKGEILKARVKSAEWHGGGERVDILSENNYRISGGYITSCDLDKPHYKISAKNVTVYPDDKVVAKDVTLKIGNMPVAFLPRYNYSLETDWPTIDVIPGKRGKWGVFALSSYRYEINKDNRVTLRLDERERWGLSEGLDYKFTSNDFGQGLLRTYYTHQRDRDRNEPVKAEEERYRIQLRHRLGIRDNITAFSEYHRLSDSEMTKDYFYREEYERESSPESYVYLLDRNPEYALSFLARKRINHFQAVTERLPELRFDLKNQELAGDWMPVYFKTDTSFTNLTRKTADNSTDSDAVRFDTFNKLSSPRRIADFLSIEPFVGMRDTFYTKNINGDEDKLRTAFYSGINISTKFFKIYDLPEESSGLGSGELRHTVTPTLKYEYIHEPSIGSGVLQQFDDIDNIDRKNTFSLGLENKLQTKRDVEGSLKSIDLGYLLLTGDYLYRPENGSRFSNVKGDLELTPFDWLGIESDTAYDPATRDFQTWNVDFYIDGSEDWRLGFGSRYWQNNEHELTSELFYKLDSEWSFRVFGRYDLKEVETNGHKIINRFANKELTIIKDLHCWLAELSLGIDRDGGTSVWLAMKLKASPKVPFDFKDYYAVPKKYGERP